MEKTHWKKHNDSRYISGDDLQSEFHGLKKEMVVCIEKFEDTETFDQQKNSTVIKTGLFLKEVNGSTLYKPVILNKTAAKIFKSATDTDYVDDWVGLPIVMFAQKDTRHGYVVRFRKYVMPALKIGTKEYENCYKAIHTNGFTIEQIKKKYSLSIDVENSLITKTDVA